MKAIQIEQIGSADVLILRDVPKPTPGAGEVLIRVDAAGVNFSDIMWRRGEYDIKTPLPFIPGAEVAGTVVALGPNVTGFAIGMPVVSAPPSGGYAQFVVAPVATTFPIPEGFSPTEVVFLMAQGLTAVLALRKSARLAQGESVLVEAAAGGVGSFAVQLAKLYGAGKVIAAASSPEKRAIAEALGADASVDYTAPGWAKSVRDLTDGRGVDVVLDLAGGDTTVQALDALAPFGRLVVIGKAAGDAPAIAPWALVEHNQSIVGFRIFGFAETPSVIQEALGELIGFVLAGKIKLQSGGAFPLAEAAEVHRLIEARKSTGKIVLQPWIED
jgi:NADPH2:quinone reductase